MVVSSASLVLYATMQPAYADGAGPLLLLVSLMAFLYGSVAIVAVEGCVIWGLCRVPLGWALLDSLVVNACSTGAIGFGLPLLLYIAALPAHALPAECRVQVLVALTWITDGGPTNALAQRWLFAWLAVSFGLTVWLEWAILRSRWTRRGHSAPRGPLAASLLMNALSYAMLAVVIWSLWGA